jgi:DNA-directed RNA polymerase specialized sigma24 family protein
LGGGYERRWRRHLYVSTGSTRCEGAAAAPSVQPPAPRAAVEEVARVAHAKRDVLLRAYRHLLRPQDLEDCYAQATLELLSHAARGGSFAGGERHAGNTLELRFVSRIRDVRRALGGRSPLQAALATALPLGSAEHLDAAVIDRRADVEQLVLMRAELRRVRCFAYLLSPDQRLVLASQLADIPCVDFCRLHGWTPEKYRKVAQRGRARLRRLMSDDQPRLGPVSRSQNGDGRGWQGPSL